MKNRTSGFTLVELMVVVLVVALVVLISTQIPLFGLSSWRKGANRLRMQRDAHLVMIKIQHELRPASFTGDPVASVPDGGTLVIGGVAFSVDSNHNLVQNGDIVISGEEGTEFIVEHNGDTIKMTLTLVRGNVDTTLTTAVKPRN